MAGVCENDNLDHKKPYTLHVKGRGGRSRQEQVPGRGSAPVDFPGLNNSMPMGVSLNT